MSFTPVIPSAGSHSGAAFSQIELINAIAEGAMFIYAELAIEEGHAVLFGYQGRRLNFIMPVPFNQGEFERTFMRTVALPELRARHCTNAGAIYPVRCTPAEGHAEGPTFPGLLIVAHAAGRPDLQALLPLKGREAGRNRFGALRQCDGDAVSIAHPELMHDVVLN